MSRKRLVLVLLGLAAAVGLLAVLLPSRTPPQTPTEFVPDAWQAARKSPMHTVHLGKGKVTCAECHGGAPPKDGGAADGGPVALGPDASLGDIQANAGFVTRPGEKSCAGCHEKAAARAHVGSEATRTTCLTCHVFRGGVVAAPCATCHAGEGAKRVGAAPLAHHVENGAACHTCHDVHAEKGKRAVLPDCTSCHTTLGARHGRQMVAAPSEGDPKLILELDAGVAVAVRKAADHGAGPTCATCHAPHTPGQRAKDACISCHVEGGAKVAGLVASSVEPPHVSPRGPKVAGHDACTTCHAPHDARKEAVKFCATCHGDKQGALEVSKGHTSCRSCHAPHAPTEAKFSCATCHAGKQALGAQKVAAHAVCSSCHAPHDPKASPAQACASCHANVHPQHPGAKTKKGDVGACIGCHAPHPGGGGTLANAASAPTSATTASCASCHDSMAGKKSGHGKHGKSVECTQCHQPHAFKLAREGAAGAAVCARCHAPVAKAVAASPTPASKGHAACAGCHGEPHSPTRNPACGTCHKDEVGTAPKGHQACTSCHEAHTGTFTQKGAACTNCHEAKKSALHGNLASGCATCHRPHGPKGVSAPPACATCHDKTKLPGLHSVDAHAKNCASCHAPHAPPRSDRATCTTGCHTDRRGHQPEAAVCKGCHIFRK